LIGCFWILVNWERSKKEHEEREKISEEKFEIEEKRWSFRIYWEWLLNLLVGFERTRVFGVERG